MGVTLPSYCGPEPLKTIENVVGNVIEIEDFTGVLQKFKLERYSSDILFLSPISGEFQGIQIEIDLGVSSVLEHIYVKRISHENVVIFHEGLLNPENQSVISENKKALEVGNIIEDMKKYYRGKIENLLGGPGKEGFIQDIITELERKGIILSAE